MREACLKLAVPAGRADLEGNLLCEQVAHLSFDWVGEGYVKEVPVSVYLPLLELGYNSLADLLTKRPGTSYDQYNRTGATTQRCRPQTQACAQ